MKISSVANDQITIQANVNKCGDYDAYGQAKKKLKDEASK